MCLEAVPHLEAASRQIFTALALVLVMDFSVLVLLVFWSWSCHKTFKARRNANVR